MAVTRRVHQITLSCIPWDEWSGANTHGDFQKALNKALGPHERIVHMEHEKNNQAKWIIVTEDLIMGPSP